MDEDLDYRLSPTDYALLNSVMADTKIRQAIENLTDEQAFYLLLEELSVFGDSDQVSDNNRARRTGDSSKSRQDS